MGDQSKLRHYRKIVSEKRSMAFLREAYCARAHILLNAEGRAWWRAVNTPEQSF